MTSAPEAYEVDEAAWYESHGIEPDPGTQAWARKLSRDMWVAALEWAAAEAERLEAAFPVEAEDDYGQSYLTGESFAEVLRDQASQLEDVQ